MSSQRNTGLQAQMYKHRGVERAMDEAQSSWKSQASKGKVLGPGLGGGGAGRTV